MNQYSWPGNRRCIGFLSVHFDAESFDLRMAAGSSLFGRYSYGRYGLRAGLPRLMGMLARRHIHATFFVPASDARRHPALVRGLVDHGHEVAARGVDLEDFARLGDKEFETLKTSRDVLADITGTMPAGFRAPGGNLSGDTLRHLGELGFLYDSSFQDADYPYRIETEQGRSIVEIPTSFALEDAPVYSARHTHERLMRIWRDEFMANYEEGVLVPLTIHLRGDIGSTRAARTAALENLLEEIQGHENIAFMTGKQLAEHTIKLGLTPEPDPLTAHLPTLKATPYRGDLSVKPI